jgi:hypothetical protein
VAGGEVDHSFDSRVDVKNEWINNYNHPTRFHGVERDLTLRASEKLKNNEYFVLIKCRIAMAKAAFYNKRALFY